MIESLWYGLKNWTNANDLVSVQVCEILQERAYKWQKELKDTPESQQVLEALKTGSQQNNYFVYDIPTNTFLFQDPDFDPPSESDKLYFSMKVTPAAARTQSTEQAEQSTPEATVGFPSITAEAAQLTPVAARTQSMEQAEQSTPKATAKLGAHDIQNYFFTVPEVVRLLEQMKQQNEELKHVAQEHRFPRCTQFDVKFPVFSGGDWTLCRNCDLQIRINPTRLNFFTSAKETIDKIATEIVEHMDIKNKNIVMPVIKAECEYCKNAKVS